MTITAITEITTKLFTLLDKLTPVWWLVLRVWIGWVFFASGLTKIEDMETTIFLFEEEYSVPLISPVFAAYSATFFELAMPFLLAFGFLTRFAALPLLAMTLVIELTYLEHVQHLYWGLILIGLVVHGAGKLSMDNYLKGKCPAKQ